MAVFLLPPPSIALLFLPVSSGNLAETRRAQHDAGALLARHIAATLTGNIPSHIVWIRDGLMCKPRVELASRPGDTIASLNLSYAQDIAACAFFLREEGQCHQEVGVDIISLTRAAKIAPSAVTLLGGSLCQTMDDGMGDSFITDGFSPHHFALRWTLLEALLKLRGSGFSIDSAARSIMSEVRAVPFSQPVIDCIQIFTCHADNTLISCHHLEESIATFAATLNNHTKNTVDTISTRLIGQFESMNATWQAITFVIEVAGQEMFVMSLAWDRAPK